MKIKKNVNKLSLSKATIATLNQSTLEAVAGGIREKTQYPCDSVHIYCKTYPQTYCVTWCYDCSMVCP